MEDQIQRIREEVTRRRIAGIVSNATNSEFWKEVLIPQFNARLATLDSEMTSEKDPWRRYALVEAYDRLKEFRMWFDDVMQAQASEDFDEEELADETSNLFPGGNS